MNLKEDLMNMFHEKLLGQLQEFITENKKLVLGNVKIKIDWGYAKDYVEAAYKIMQLKKMIFILLVVEKTSILDFVKDVLNMLG